MKYIKKLIGLSIFLLAIILTGCRLMGDYPYRIEPGEEYLYLDKYSLMVDEMVVYDISFPGEVYVSKDWDSLAVLFEEENDYRIMSDWVKEVLYISSLAQVYPQSEKQTMIEVTLSKGASKSNFNYVNLTVDDGVYFHKSINFMTQEGYLFYLVYDEFVVDDETVYVPKELGPAYEVAYIPDTFNIDYGRTTVNGVKVERRIENESYDYDYVYIIPYPAIKRGSNYNLFRTLASGFYSGVDIEEINNIMPKTGTDYHLCENTDADNKCFEYIDSWYRRITYVDIIDFEDFVSFYETYYDGELVDNELYFTFNEKEYVYKKVNNLEYKLIPVMTFEINSD